MLPYLKKYSLQYLLGTFLLILVNLLAAYIPELIRDAVDNLQNFAKNLTQSNLEKKIFYLLSLIVILSLIMSWIRTQSRQVIFGIGRLVEFDLKKDIFNHLVSMQTSFFSARRTGDLISIISNDVQSIRSLAGFAMLNIVNTVIAFAIVLPLMFNLHFKLTIYFLLSIPFVIIFIIGLSGSIKTLQEHVQIKLGEISNFIEQNLSGIHIIKTFAQENFEVARFGEYNTKLKNDYIKLVGLRSLIGPVMRVAASIGFIMLLFVGGNSVIDGKFSPGDFTAYGLYIQRLIWPIATLGWLITLVYRAQVSEKRILSVLHEMPAIKDQPNAVSKSDFINKIEFKKLGVELKHATNLAVIGVIGSGKTILANKLMHLKELDNDEILLDGIDVKDIKLDSLRTLINLVPQENFLFSTSLAENIAYAKDLSQVEIEYFAKLVNIHDEIMNFPEGYQSLVGERGITLSGGQRQRIAIARALALDPEILILDDSLSSLDNHNAEDILSKILELRKNKTTIFITHKLSVTKFFDEVWELEQGRVINRHIHKGVSDAE